uniref:Tyrosine-protein phosphatase domain-containing protein n=1 Tax=Caenorhabditis tropicalis TaxID=1561998 RepID=A0A1I7TK63_9PELO
MALNSEVMFRDQINAMRLQTGRKRATSLQSFCSGNNEDSTTESIDNMELMVDYPQQKGVSQMRTRFNSDTTLSKSFRKKVKKLAQKDRRSKQKINGDYDEDEIEVARGAPTSYAAPSKLRKSKALDCLVSEKAKAANNEDIGASADIEMAKSHFNDVRMKVFAARTAMQVEPALVVKTRKVLESKSTVLGNDQSPGAFSLHAAYKIASTPDSRVGSVTQSTKKVSKEAMANLIRTSYDDTEITQDLLFSSKFDTKWKGRYTDIYMRRDENGKKPKRPVNGQGWVMPLKSICEKFGISPSFFTDHRIDLQSARDQVLLMRLLSKDQTSSWISDIHPEAVKNETMVEYLLHDLDASTMQKRVQAFKANVLADRDRVRVAGQFYNNIRIGKRMFGAARKAKYVSTIIGGMERRFEILENSVNHIPFTHTASDANKDKCRNSRVHCKDSTRITVTFPSGQYLNDFVHANRVSGKPLFNEFILTQAPLANTVDDFWRMVWQEEVPYIVMLTSRKEPERCTSYWPKSPSDAPIVVSGGVRVENFGIYQAPDPLFRVTHLRLIGPDNEERHVEHWQGDVNNSSNMYSPLNILRLLRNTSKPVIIHDHLGVSRAACLVAAEIAICSLLRGPTYKYPVQRAVQFLRQRRPFSIETPMQYIFVHRLVSFFFRDIMGSAKEVDMDYERWLQDRSERMFLDDISAPIAGYRLLSPRADPDIVRMVGRPERPNYRREAPDCVGEMPNKIKTIDEILTPAKSVFNF